MKISNALILAFALAAFAFALDGNESHTITMDRGFFSTDYTVDGKESNLDEVEELLLYVPDANEMWSSGNTLRYVSWGMAFVGGFGVGYGIVESQNAIGEGTFQNGRGVYIIGGGLLVVAALIMEHIGNSKKDSAIELYNSSSGKTPKYDGFGTPIESSYNIQLAPTANGAALAFNF